MSQIPPEFSDSQNLKKDEEVIIAKWHEGDAKTQTQIELTVGDVEMVHLSGAETVWEMWDQLCMVKESKGQIGILATCRALVLPWFGSVQGPEPKIRLGSSSQAIQIGSGAARSG